MKPFPRPARRSVLRSVSAVSAGAFAVIAYVYITLPDVRSLATTNPMTTAFMSYPDGVVTPVTNDLSSYLGLDIDADRKNVVTARSETRVGIWVGNADPSTPPGTAPSTSLGTGRGSEIVTPFPFTSSLMSMDWLGERLVFDGTTTDVFTIGSVVPGKGEPVELASNASLPAGTWDGKTIVFSRAAGETGLWKMDAAGGSQPVQLLKGLSMFPIVTPDDRSVIFLTGSTGIQSPWIMIAAK